MSTFFNDENVIFGDSSFSQQKILSGKNNLSKYTQSKNISAHNTLSYIQIFLRQNSQRSRCKLTAKFPISLWPISLVLLVQKIPNFSIFFLTANSLISHSKIYSSLYKILFN